MGIRWLVVSTMTMIGCSLQPASSFQKTIRIELSGVHDPALLTGYCYGVNVTGSGIASQEPGAACSGMPAPGILGGLVDASGGAIEVFVPTGPARTFQIFRVSYTGTSCPKISNVKTDLLNNASISNIVELGRETIDVFTETSLRVPTGTTTPTMFCGSALPMFQSLAVFSEDSDVDEETDHPVR